MVNKKHKILNDLFGILTEEEVNKLENEIKKGREEHRKLRELRMKRLFDL